MNLKCKQRPKQSTAKAAVTAAATETCQQRLSVYMTRNEKTVTLHDFSAEASKPSKKMKLILRAIAKQTMFVTLQLSNCAPYVNCE